MKVGILGSSAVGQALATGFLSENYEVMVGTRDTTKKDLVKWHQENPAAALGSFSDTAKFGDVLVLAVSGDAAKKVIDLAGTENFANKVVIDTTNPMEKAAPEKGVIRYFTNQNHSLMEDLQSIVPEAKFVKAFNSIGSSFMYKPRFPEGKPTMFICGNDERAKTVVTDVLQLFGFDTEDMGTAEAARAIEPLAILWCIPGFIRNDWAHAFRLLKI